MLTSTHAGGLRHQSRAGPYSTVGHTRGSNMARLGSGPPRIIRKAVIIKEIYILHCNGPMDQWLQVYTKRRRDQREKSTTGSY